MQVGSNSEFIYKQFNRQMEKTVMEVKGEIESFCQNKINSIAQAALIEQRENILKLENPVDINIGGVGFEIIVLFSEGGKIVSSTLIDLEEK